MGEDTEFFLFTPNSAYVMLFDSTAQQAYFDEAGFS